MKLSLILLGTVKGFLLEVTFALLRNSSSAHLSPWDADLHKNGD